MLLLLNVFILNVFRSLWAKAFGFHEINENWPAVKYSVPRQCVLKYNGRGVAVQQYNVPIKMMQILPAFYLLLVGFGVAFFLFLVENIYFRIKSSK